MSRERRGFETFEHGADIGVRGRGSTLEEAFASGARAMFSIVLESPPSSPPSCSVPVSCTSFDMEALFVAWLNELLAKADMERAVFWEFAIEIDPVEFAVQGSASGWRLDDIEAELGVEVKGATFTLAKVEHMDGEWVAQCVVDV